MPCAGARLLSRWAAVHQQGPLETPGRTCAILPHNPMTILQHAAGSGAAIKDRHVSRHRSEPRASRRRSTCCHRRNPSGERLARIDAGGSARGRGKGEQGSGTQRDSQLSAGFSGATHHLESRACRSAQGRRTFRSGNCAWVAGGERAGSDTGARWCGVSGRTGAVRRDTAGARRIARRIGRSGSGTYIDRSGSKR